MHHYLSTDTRGDEETAVHDASLAEPGLTNMGEPSSVCQVRVRAISLVYPSFSP